jgi:RND family efflux transporter MFP subunit
LEQAKTRLKADNEVLSRAAAALERDEALAKRRANSKRTLDNARKAHEQAQTQTKLDEAAVERLEAALHTAEINLGSTNIASPIDGIVVSRNVEMGQTVAAGAETPLFIIASDLSTMLVNVEVNEKDIGAINVGEKVSITVEAFPSRIFAGGVTRIDQSPQKSATYDVVITVLNPELLLKPGMSATIRMPTDKGGKI